MKKLLCLWTAAIFLTGCSAGDQLMEEALAFRGRLLGAERIGFCVRIVADYIDHAEVFSLECTADREGTVAFRVAEPEEISGITGSVAGKTGTLSFDGTILAFPLMEDAGISPVGAPGVLLSALRSGFITACTREGELLRVTLDDGYGEDVLTVDVWLLGQTPVAAEVSRQGIRLVSMELEDFSLDGGE